MDTTTPITTEFLAGLAAEIRRTPEGAAAMDAVPLTCTDIDATHRWLLPGGVVAIIEHSTYSDGTETTELLQGRTSSPLMTGPTRKLTPETLAAVVARLDAAGRRVTDLELMIARAAARLRAS